MTRDYLVQRRATISECIQKLRVRLKMMEEEVVNAEGTLRQYEGAQKLLNELIAECVESDHEVPATAADR